MADYKLNHTGAEVDSAIDKANTADSNWSLLMANLGIGRWANQTLFNSATSNYILDVLIPYYSAMDRYIAYLNFRYAPNNGLINEQIILDCKDTTRKKNHSATAFAFGASNPRLKISNAWLHECRSAFSCGNIVELTLDNINFTGNVREMFANSKTLNSIEGSTSSFRDITSTYNMFLNTPSLTTIKLSNLKISFNIATTGITTSEQLQNVIDSMIASSNQTLTINATQNSAMTDTQRTYLTDTLGWSIAVA